MCNWTSKITNIKCERESLEGSEYCLFHKPKKTNDEAALFYRIINFKQFSQRYLELLSSRKPQDYPHSLELREEHLKTIDLNFTLEERLDPEYIQNKQRVEKLYKESKISGRGNIIAPDFIGFVFPVIELFEFKFEYQYNPFSYATLFFKECIFEGFTDFSGFNFLGETRFEDCDFSAGCVLFTNAIFHKNVTFIGSNLNKAFSIDNNGMFQGAKFNGNNVIFDNVKGLIEFDSEFYEKTDLELIKMDYPIDYGSASYGEKAYRLAKIQKNRMGEYDRAMYYYYLEKCYKGYQILPKPYYWDRSQKGLKKIQIVTYLKDDDNYQKIPHKIIDLIFKHTLGYGEKPNLALMTLFVLVFIFAFVYMFIGDISVNHRIINYDFYISKELFSLKHWSKVLNDFGNCIYFSMVTLTTVGYGDVTPSSGIGKFISGVEMFLGVTFVGAWTATLLRKLMK